MFRSAVPVGRAFLHSTDTSQHKKIRQPENRQPYFFRCSFLIFTRSLPAFGRAYASTIPLHFVTVIRSLNALFHYAESFTQSLLYIQPYYVCRPQCFQRLLLRTAIGVGAAYLQSFSSKTFLIIINCELSIINCHGHFALNQGTPPRRVT